MAEAREARVVATIDQDERASEAKVCCLSFASAICCSLDSLASGDSEAFLSHCVIANYCSLAFLKLYCSCFMALQ